MSFLYGPMLDSALREIVIPNAGAGEAANGQMNGATVAGLLFDLQDEAQARLTYFAACFGAATQKVTVQVGARKSENAHNSARLGASANDKAAQAFGGALEGPFSAGDGNTDTTANAQIVQYAARDVMAQFGQRDAAVMRRSVGMILVRAASNLRAGSEDPLQTHRHGFKRSDVQCIEKRTPYLGFFAVEEQDVRFRRFDGSFSDPVKRAAFVSGDAVTVLPYDPVRDRVLVIEQFRFGPLVRGDTHPWSIEPIAGRIDPGESPEESARREAIEETGLTLQKLRQVANYYPSPGAVSEYLYSFVALADLPDEVAKIGGLDSEAEDIRGILLSFEALMEMIQTGAAQNGPLILSAYWLKSERDRLRTSA